jgi:hypothetical protein
MLNGKEIIMDNYEPEVWPHAHGIYSTLKLLVKNKQKCLEDSDTKELLIECQDLIKEILYWD